MSAYKSRKPPAKQRLISSFFLPLSGTASAPVAAPKAPTAPKETTDVAKKKVKTPEKVAEALRTLSGLAKETQNRSAFEEPASSDTSFISPEIDNFRNPILKSLTGKAAGLPSARKPEQELLVISDGEVEKENRRPATQEHHRSPFRSQPVLKRAATSNMLDFLSEKPKKLRKLQVAAPPTPPSSVGSLDVGLSEAQLEIVDAVVKRDESVFFTGSAGTGKSVVLRKLVTELYRKHGSHRVGVTASTGLAACNIKGQTLHKFLSIGLGTASAALLSKQILKNLSSKRKWQTLRVLLIDEILMIDGRLFSKIDEIAQVVRNKPAPFGGIQLVCSGDFYQLPPVAKDGTSQYCFDSPSWKRALKNTMVLTKVFRQEGDKQLIDMLNALREGNFSQELLQLFHLLKRKVDYTDGIEPTELFPTRYEVKHANDARLQNLKSNSFTFVANDSTSDPRLKKMFDNLMCEEVLTLKVGAQVMYLKNHPDNTVVNGSIGKVIGFLPDSLFAGFFELFHPQDFIDATSKFIQMVEFLCNAVGVATLPNGLRDIYESFSDQWKLKLAPLLRQATMTSKDLILLPVINFKTNDESTMIQVKKEEFTVEYKNFDSKPEPLVREQLPLILAWAMSIHKSQGQSIDRLRVDLRRTFEKGQIYVALSRATNKEQLEVYNFDHRRITVSKVVQEFYKSLKHAGE